MDHGVVVLEHVDFVNLGQSLHAYKKENWLDLPGITGSLTELFDGRLEFLIFSNLSLSVGLLLSPPLGTCCKSTLALLPRGSHRQGSYLFLQFEFCLRIWQRVLLAHQQLLDPSYFAYVSVTAQRRPYIY